MTSKQSLNYATTQHHNKKILSTYTTTINQAKKIIIINKNTKKKMIKPLILFPHNDILLFTIENLAAPAHLIIQ